MAENKNRCWPGYEPVKDKKPRTQGSCRPKAKSKLRASEKSFRAKRRKQLDKWQAEHPKSRKSAAAQHLVAPGDKRRRPKRKSSSSKRRSSGT
jgi:hypothetical protein